MKTLYLDIFSGISGDMFIGAMLDLGVSFAGLESELSKLNLGDFHVHAARKHKSSIEGVKFDVHAHEHEHHHDHAAIPAHAHEHGHSHSHAHEYDYEAEDEHEHEHEHGRTFNDIRTLILDSSLTAWVKEKSIAVFERIARAEGKIHGKPPEQVHFHEVGAVDSIVDIVGASICLELLGKPHVVAAPVVDGTGWIKCAHGRFPIPAPATIAILAERGVPISQCDEPHELVTPTGAAILAEFVNDFGPLRLVPERVGYGLGERDNKTRPNVLRVIIGDSLTPLAEHDWETDQVGVLETNLDDISSEILGHVADKAFSAGALDVFYTAVQMKKNRPGVVLTILCSPTEQDRFTELLLRETSAFGVRRYVAERRKLKREVRSIKTEFGEVEVKFGLLDGKEVQAAPEFESCKRVAAECGVPIKMVYQAAAVAIRSGSNP